MSRDAAKPQRWGLKQTTEREMMQFLINKTKADEVIRTAPAISGGDVVCKHNVRVELFDYGTRMGWGYDVRVRVFMDDKPLPFGAERIYDRNRPAWLPADMTVDGWNTAVQAAIQKLPL